MAKYIDSEKLNAEIKRRLVKYDTDYTSAGIELKELLSFINSIQQEQPEVDLEKASRNVYESWMGGTKNDVRRDMVELGKVLNARKEDSK